MNKYTFQIFHKGDINCEIVIGEITIYAKDEQEAVMTSYNFIDHDNVTLQPLRSNCGSDTNQAIFDFIKDEINELDKHDHNTLQELCYDELKELMAMFPEDAEERLSIEAEMRLREKHSTLPTKLSVE